MLGEVKKRCESAELYSAENREDIVSFENGRLKEAESSVTNGRSLRMIGNGRVGFSFTTNMREKLAENCYESMKAGSEARFSLPKTLSVKKVDSFDPSAEEADNEEVVRECER